MHVLAREQRVDRPLDEVFAFYADALNLERITPPWLRFRVVTPGPITMAPGHADRVSAAAARAAGALAHPDRLGPLGELARRALVARDLERIFAHRQAAVAQYFTK